MGSVGDLKGPHPAATLPPIAAPPQPPPPSAATAAAAAIAAPVVRAPQSHLARVAFLVLAALTSAAWFVEPFADAADELRLPWPTAVASLVLLAAFFYASVHLFRSFFLSRPPPAATAAVQWEWEGAGAIAVAVIIASVGIAVAACLVASGRSAYGYAPARS